jgi:hypothetical protein
MSKTEASPCVNTGTKEKRIALTRGELIHILFQYEKDVKDVDDLSPFLDEVFNGQDGAIVFDSQAKAGERFGNPGPVIGKGNVPIYNEEGNSNEGDIVLDLGSSYLCDFCGHLWKGREIKILESGHLLCCWCEAAEVNYGIYRKERI